MVNDFFVIIYDNLSIKKKVIKDVVYFLTNSSPSQFFTSIDIFDQMGFLNSPFYLVFKYIYFYGSVMYIFSVIGENVTTSQKKKITQKWPGM